MQEHIQKRHYNNCIAFIVIYTLTGVMSGLIYDILITYLMTISPEAAKSIASYMGAAAFAASALTALTSKTGYRKILLSAPIAIAVSLVLVSYSVKPWLISMAVFFLITGTTVFDVILAPYIAAYTTNANRTSFFTKTSYASIVGIISGTLAGGPIIVWIFSKKLGITYYEAKLLTSSIKDMNPEQLLYYIASYRMVLLGFAVVSILMLIPALSIKESREDYQIEQDVEDNRVSLQSTLMNKYIVLFLVYTAIGRFAASLIVPYVSIYLTDIGIDRAAVSVLSMLQYLAILIFMPFSAKITGKIGQVNTIAFICLISVPFMFILGNGYNYGSSVEIIVGAALFFRAGLANTVAPVTNSFTMELVSKIYRPLFASLVFVTQGIAQISAGLFTKYYLFNTGHGYANAYYYAAALYILAHVMLLAVFSKKYNRTQDLQC